MAGEAEIRALFTKLAENMVNARVISAEPDPQLESLQISLSNGVSFRIPISAAIVALREVR